MSDSGEAGLVSDGNSHAVYTGIFVLLFYVTPIAALATALVLYTQGTARKIVVYALSTVVCAILAYVVIMNVFLHPNG